MELVWAERLLIQLTNLFCSDLRLLYPFHTFGGQNLTHHMNTINEIIARIVQQIEIHLII